MFVSCQRQLLSTNAYCGSACGAVLAKKSGMAKTQNKTKPKLDQNWKTAKPGTLTRGLQTARNLVKPIDLNYLEA